MTYNPMLDTGVVAGRHTLITQQGTDFWTNNELPLLPEGESAVIRLGNNQSGAEAESIVYTFTVDPDHSILLIKYAVVLENPSHESLAQPRFIIRMLDENNELLDPCMEYDVTSADDIPGFQSFGHIRWRPWTNNGFDLSTYVGQTVKLQLITYDCSWGAHFGYAYFTASCISNRLSLDGCDGNQVTLSAPTGFSSYNWSNGATTETTNFTVQGNSTVNCVISTVTEGNRIRATASICLLLTIWESAFFTTPISTNPTAPTILPQRSISMRNSVISISMTWPAKETTMTKTDSILRI